MVAAPGIAGILSSVSVSAGVVGFHITKTVRSGHADAAGMDSASSGVA